MALKLYSALMKRDDDCKIEDIALVKENFSISAMIFNLLWFLCHKMWQNSVILVVFQFVLFKFVAIELISGVDLFFVEIALFIAIGMNANYWYGVHLGQKGYKKISYVLAQNEEEARLKAMKSLHRNSPDLSFDEFSDEIIDPDFYLKSVKSKNVKI